MPASRAADQAADQDDVMEAIICASQGQNGEVQEANICPPHKAIELERLVFLCRQIPNFDTVEDYLAYVASIGTLLDLPDKTIRDANAAYLFHNFLPEVLGQIARNLSVGSDLRNLLAYVDRSSHSITKHIYLTGNEAYLTHHLVRAFSSCI